LSIVVVKVGISLTNTEPEAVATGSDKLEARMVQQLPGRYRFRFCIRLASAEF
jgi:hypothetical protein